MARSLIALRPDGNANAGSSLPVMWIAREYGCLSPSPQSLPREGGLKDRVFNRDWYNGNFERSQGFKGAFAVAGVDDAVFPASIRQIARWMQGAEYEDSGRSALARQPVFRRPGIMRLERYRAISRLRTRVPGFTLWKNPEKSEKTFQIKKGKRTKNKGKRSPAPLDAASWQPSRRSATVPSMAKLPSLPAEAPKVENLDDARQAIAEIWALNLELLALLGQNSRNSSRPPSSDGPGSGGSKKAAAEGEPDTPRRKRGAQPGHKDSAGRWSSMST